MQIQHVFWIRAKTFTHRVNATKMDGWWVNHFIVNKDEKNSVKQQGKKTQFCIFALFLFTDLFVWQVVEMFMFKGVRVLQLHSNQYGMEMNPLMQITVNMFHFNSCA